VLREGDPRKGWLFIIIEGVLRLEAENSDQTS
jgi:CRP-like cAMP-binding protein